MTRLLIVRHARAAAADDLRLPGPDVALLPEGVRQARALAERLSQLAPATVYASDARRAWQTGEIVAAACQCELYRSAALREIDFGDWGGQTFADLAATDPRVGDWFADPASDAPPGGESGVAAAERVLRFFGEIGERPQRTPSAPRTPSPPTPSPVEPGEGAFGRVDMECVVVVGHAGSLRLALAEALGMPLAAYWRLRLDCASLSMLKWTSEGPIVESLNDVSHLAALEAEDACPTREVNS